MPDDATRIELTTGHVMYDDGHGYVTLSREGIQHVGTYANREDALIAAFKDNPSTSTPWMAILLFGFLALSPMMVGDVTLVQWLLGAFKAIGAAALAFVAFVAILLLTAIVEDSGKTPRQRAHDAARSERWMQQAERQRKRDKQMREQVKQARKERLARTDARVREIQMRSTARRF